MLQLAWIEVRVRSSEVDESLICSIDCLYPKKPASSKSISSSPNDDVKNDVDDVRWKRTIVLHQNCHYCPLIVFIWHLFNFPQYRARVTATLQSTLNRLPLPGTPMDHNSPVKAAICFNLVNCDSISPIDKSWCHKILKFAVLRMEIEEALSWLSTLGGAFSSLGDRNVNFARKAGQISMNQLRLSYVFGDPNLIARCFIYMCHSLCQQGHRKKAIKLGRTLLYPQIMAMGDKCERIVSQMYRSLRFRISFIYK